MRFLNASILASGARETIVSVTSRAARCGTAPSMWSTTNEQLGHPSLPVRAEHEVVDDELAAPVEQVGERDLSLRRVEDVVLVDLDPGQLAPLRASSSRWRVSSFSLREQRLARGEPFSP